MDSLSDQSPSFTFVSVPSYTTAESTKLSKKEKCSKRNSGEAYTTKSGKVIPQRSIKPLENCRRNCRSKVTPQDQTSIFTEYWKKGSYNHRFRFVSNLVKLESKKRDRSRFNLRDRQFNANYHLTVNSQLVKVCKKCFLQTLGENYGFVRNVLVKCWTGKDKDPILDGRGKRSPKNKTKPEKIVELENHIKRFPVSEDYCPNMKHTLKFLPDGFNALKMHGLYAAEVKEPLSRNMYRKVLAETGLKFRNQGSSVCNECNILNYEQKTEIINDDENDSEESVMYIDEEENKEYQDYDHDSNQNNTEKVDSADQQHNGFKKIQNEASFFEIEVDPVLIIDESDHEDLSSEATESMTDYPLSTTTRSERTRRSLLKNSGEAYITESGKFIPKRSVKPLEKCKSNCRLKISPEDQNRIFDSYWKEGDYKYRQSFIADLVTLFSPKVRILCRKKNRKFSVNYFLPGDKGKVQVCKKCFLQTLGENVGFVKNVLTKCWNNRSY